MTDQSDWNYLFIPGGAVEHWVYDDEYLPGDDEKRDELEQLAKSED